MHSSAGVLLALAVPVCLLAGCTSGPGPDGSVSAATPPVESSGAAASTTEPSPTGTTAPPEVTASFSQPLVLAFDVHRPRLHLTHRQARRVITGKLPSWPELGQPGGQIRLVSPVERQQLRRAVIRAASHPDMIVVAPAAAVTPQVQVASVGGLDPLRSPQRYRPRTSARASQPKVATVTFVGDIMLGRGVAAAHPEGVGPIFDPLGDRLAGADLTVGNLESTLSTAGPAQQGDDSFSADPAVLAELSAAGFDLLSLANNHTGDFGERAIRQTLREMDRSTIARVGAGVDAAGAWRPAVLETGGTRFGFLAFNAIGETPRATASSPGAAEIRMQPRTGPLNLHDLRRMTDEVARLAKRVDVVIVLPHWGGQYTYTAVPAQRRAARALVDAGADAVIGGHPHWVQGARLRRGALIAYCLGNFVFDMDFSIPTQEGMLAELVFWGDDLKGFRFTPYVIDPDYSPRLAGDRRGRQILSHAWKASGTPF